MKVIVDREEWLPVYTMTPEEEENPDQPGFELPLQEFADYKRVIREFEAWQKRLSEMYKD